MHAVFAVIAFVAGIPLVAIASTVLPTPRTLSRRELIGGGLAAGVVGLIAALPGRGVVGPVATAVAAVLFVVIYGRLARA